MSDKIITLKQVDTGDRLLPKTVKEAILDLEIDQTFDDESSNPQSGVAIKGALSDVAFSGSYADLENKPTIPSAQVQADWNEASSSSMAYILNKPTIPAAQVQANWNETDTTSKAYILNKPTIPSGVTVDQVYDGTSANAQSGVAVNGALGSYQLIAQDMTTLSASGTIALTDNTVNKISATGSVTFTLPTVTVLTKFHQIFVQLSMASAQTIDLGTTYYFNSTAPDLSAAGTYNLYFEYDNTASHWVAGCLGKGSV